MRRNLKETLLDLYPFDLHSFVRDWDRMRPLLQKPLDYGSIPKFEDRFPEIGEALGGTIVRVSVLLLLNGLFFMLSFCFFRRV